MRSRIVPIVLLMLLAVPAAYARTYFDAYNEGLKAASNRDWDTVVTKMTEAIKGNAKEGRVRPYGTIFEEYHPYYYRGIAYVELGRYQEGIADLRKSNGPGKVQIGSISEYISRAETKLAGPVTPPPVTDTRSSGDDRPPVVDPAIAQNRSRADQLLREAQRARDQARGGKAETYAASQFTQGMRLLEGASDKRITASTADEWRAVADDADKAQRAFLASLERARDQATRTDTITEIATEDVMAAGRNEVRKALELYFSGEFDRSANAFQRLAEGSQRGNSMVWAFLGASRYYSYYLGGSSNQTQLSAATDAFRRARRINPAMKLSAKYFAPRIRNFYTKVK
ncbi:MAG: hypothetical protein ACYC7A_00940 [Thermoanaerobaculia bacterium]